MLSSRFPGESLLLYKQAAKSGHAAAMYNWAVTSTKKRER